MGKFENRLGLFLAGMLIAMIALSVLSSLFNLFFRDGRGFPAAGNRGEYYLSEWLSKQLSDIFLLCQR